MADKPGARVSLRETMNAGFLLALFLGLSVSGSYLRGQSLFFQAIWDPVGIYTLYPGDEVAISSFQDGRFPLWDSSRGLGSPHVMPTFGTSDFPLKVLAYLIDSDFGWELYILLRLWLAGIFCFMAARELPLGFRGSLFAALSFMLCGHFREFLNLPDLNVALLFPLTLFFLLRFARRRSLAALIGIIVTGHFLDNNPESTMYAMIHLTIYYGLACILVAREQNWPLSKLIKVFIVYPFAVTIAIAIDMDNIFMLFEYFVRSWSFHPAGLGQVYIPASSLIGLATPIFDYWILNVPQLSLDNLEQLTLVPAYLGMITFILAAFALTRPARIPAQGLAMVIAALVFAGMIFGVPPFNLFNRLPLFRMFQNFRYAQPYLAFALALLAGMGLELIIREPAKRKQALIIALLVLVWIAVHFYRFRYQVASSGLVLFGAAALIAAALICAGIAFWFSRRLPHRRDQVTAWSLIILCGLELALYFNLARPLYGPQAFQIESTPAVDFLNRQEGKPFRIFGAEQRILHPNLAGLYGLSDLRDQSPLYIRNYVQTMARLNQWRTPTEIIQGFLKDGRFYFDLDLNQVSAAQLGALNLRYLLAYAPPGTRPLISEAAAVSIRAPAENYVSLSEFAVGGVFRRAIILHAPARLAIEPADVDQSLLLGLAAAILEHADKCPETDGVSLFIMSKAGGHHQLKYARHLRVDRDRNWLPFEIELSRGDKELILGSLPGPKNDPRCDYASFSAPLIMPRADKRLAAHRLKKVYDREVQVYENLDCKPRVFGVDRALPCQDADQCGQGWFEEDPSRSVRVKGLSRPELTLSRPVISGITESQSRLTFKADSPGRALAVISNLYFPGWRAYVNGVERRVFQVNGAAQGVFLSAGESQVELIYHPWTFRIGIWIRLLGPLAIIILAALAYGTKTWRIDQGR